MQLKEGDRVVIKNKGPYSSINVGDSGIIVGIYEDSHAVCVRIDGSPYGPINFLPEWLERAKCPCGAASMGIECAAWCPSRAERNEEKAEGEL